jgi:hypothetical protein
VSEAQWYVLDKDVLPLFNICVTAIATADGALKSSDVPSDMTDMFKAMRDKLVLCRDQGEKWPPLQ